jgi:hypothetical protein
LLLHHERGGRRRAALGLGVVTGLALLTKFTGWLLLAFIAVRAVFLAFRSERARAAGLAWAFALALLIAAPWLVRNQLLFGSPVYPVLAPDMDRALYALNSHKFSVPPLDFLRATPLALGWPILGVALTALIVAAARRDGSLRTWLLAFSIVGVISVAFTPMAATRHLNPFLPLLTLASAAILLDAIAARRVAALTLCGALVVVASTVVFALPEVRATADAPEYLRDAFREIGPRLPERSTVLSLWTYDTFYYTRRAATWPIPWGQKSHPVEMFYERDPDRFLAELDRHGIDYLLIPRELRSREFDSANYPASFMVLADSLVKRGDLRVTWASERLALVHPGCNRPLVYRETVFSARARTPWASRALSGDGATGETAAGADTALASCGSRARGAGRAQRGRAPEAGAMNRSARAVTTTPRCRGGSSRATPRWADAAARSTEQRYQRERRQHGRGAGSRSGREQPTTRAPKARPWRAVPRQAHRQREREHRGERPHAELASS